MPHVASSLQEEAPSDLPIEFCISNSSLEVTLPEIFAADKTEHEPLPAPDLDLDPSTDAEPTVMVVDLLLESFEAAWMGGSSKSQSQPKPSPPSASSPYPVHPMLIPANRAAPSTEHHILSSTSSHLHSDTEPTAAFAPSTPYHSTLLSTPIPAAQPPSSTPLPAPETPAAAPAAIPTKSEFSSVFFSPIPLSYLGMPHSDSIDSNLASSLGSLGSPTDASLRRQGTTGLSAAVAGTDWAEVSKQEAAAAAAAGLGLSATPLTALDASSAKLPQQQQQQAPLSNGKRKAQSPDSVLEAAAGRSSTPQHQQQHQQQQQEQGRQAQAALVPMAAASALERSSDTPSPSTTLQLEVAADGARSPVSKPLAPAGLHPILSRPPASASGSPTSSPPNLTPCLTPTPSSSSLLAPTPQPAATSMLLDLPLDLPPTHLLHAPIPLPGPMSIAAAARAPASATPRAPLRLVVGSAMIPHVDKVEKGGEDALCICTHGLGAIGVADGVSGWAEEGIDPAAYSRSLMGHAADALDRALLQRGPAGADPREVIRYAHQSTVMAGSSTICVAVMKPAGKVHVGNLGDSGVRLIRGGKTLFASAAQQHMFNMPFQLSHPSIIESPDDADSADVSMLDVQPGDILVMATDGLYDNVFDEEIAGICTHMARAPGAGVSSQAAAQAMAASVAHTAHRYALDPHQRTPWSVAASETGMPWARFFAKGGGKMDDVTVLVAFVVEEDN